MYLPANKIYEKGGILAQRTVAGWNKELYMNNDLYSESVQQTYTAEQISKILGVSVRKAYMICEQTNDFIVKRLGPRCLRINKESFDKWFNQADSSP